MTAVSLIRGFFGAAVLAAGLGGCAPIVGIEDFTVGEPGEATGGGVPVDICNAVHGCTREDAEDFTGFPNVTISFESNGYDPRCILVSNGAMVHFKSNSYTFNDFPIAGGVSPVADTESPIKQPSDPTVNQIDVTLMGECSYPYFSPGHGKNGVIFLPTD